MIYTVHISCSQGLLKHCSLVNTFISFWYSVFYLILLYTVHISCVQSKFSGKIFPEILLLIKNVCTFRHFFKKKNSISCMCVIVFIQHLLLVLTNSISLYYSYLIISYTAMFHLSIPIYIITIHILFMQNIYKIVMQM